MGDCSSKDSTLQPLPVLSSRGMVHELKMSVYRDKESDLQMFNYCSNSLHRNIYHFDRNSIVFREENFAKRIMEVDQVKEAGDPTQKALFGVERKHNYFKITPYPLQTNETDVIQRALWLVVRATPLKKQHIREKETIKLGRQRIKIRQIVLQDHHHNAVIDLSEIKTKRVVYETVRFRNEEEQFKFELDNVSVEGEEQICRICLEVGSTKDPLICPCKCKGSVRFIHLKCLRKWLDKRLNVTKKDNCIVVKWTPLTCQMCKNHFKYRVYLDNIKYYTLDIPKPEKPYIVLEATGKTVEFSKIFLFVSFHKKTVMPIGRSKTVDINLTDITISRHHATIFYDQIEKKFYLTDNQSKYGTFLHIRDNLLINPQQKHISFQIGGELFSFEAFRKKAVFVGFHEEERYLNVVEQGSEDILVSESEEDEEEHEELEDSISSEQQEEGEIEARVQELKPKISSFKNMPPLTLTDRRQTSLT